MARRSRWVLLALAVSAAVAAPVLLTRSFHAEGLRCGTPLHPEELVAQAWEDVDAVQEAFEAAGGNPCTAEADRRKATSGALAAAAMAAIAAGLGFARGRRRDGASSAPDRTEVSA